MPAQGGPAFVEELQGYQLLVYNMGDYMPYHAGIYEVALACPGVIVLHDLVLRDLFMQYCRIRHWMPSEFVRLMGYSHGPAGEQLARALLSNERIDSHDDPTRLEQPLFLPALHRCLGVVVHSDYARQRVGEVTHAPLEKIDFPLFGPAQELEKGPAAFARPSGQRVQLLTVGIINPNKLVHSAIQAIGQSNLLRHQVAYTVIGTPRESYHQDLQSLIQLYGLHDVVHLAGWCSDEALRKALAGSDVVINLRNPHLGESSASLLDSLLAGVPTIVWNHGFYAEFPDDVVCKISSENELRPLLEKLVQNPRWRQEIGRNARAHARERFSTDRYCERFRAFAEKALYHKPMLRLADHVSDRLLELGPQPVDGLADRLAAEIAFFAPDRTRTSGLAKAA
jgi:glycosyltransferase involved in cell wall biosynthesis